MAPLSYLEDPFVGRRRPTREVHVGDVAIGGDQPIRVQSMTNTDTRDVRATVDQIEGLAGVGCEIVRLTVPSIRDAEVLAEIRSQLARRRVTVPLVADIHFTPNAAMIAAEHVEKVRVNPGNYVDKKKFAVMEFSDAEYGVELERVADRFRPLVRRCKERGVAMRIGTNHGSLSDRIMNRFGDTPLGMVESALEFLDVCEAESYFDVVFSMKASNTQVAIQAYRLLAARLGERRRTGQGPGDYPFHVGVTEAGDSEDGRIKSAIGIGSLLEDGLGDTIRVSLTEDPKREVPVAAAIARRAEARWREDLDQARLSLTPAYVRDPYAHERRASRSLSLAGLDVGGAEPVRVELDLGLVPVEGSDERKRWASMTAAALAGVRDVTCEGIALAVEDTKQLEAISALRADLVAGGLGIPLAVSMPVTAQLDAVTAKLDGVLSRLIARVSSETEPMGLAAAAALAMRAGVALEWRLCAEVGALPALVAAVAEASRAASLKQLLFSCDSPRSTHAARVLVSCLEEQGFSDAPVVLRYREPARSNDEASMIDAGIDLGAPLCDGLGDLVSLARFRDPARALDLAYRILQGSRLRTTRTEYISCPSCGRTLFDLEEVTARIKSRTEHLRGVKIAVMGCIVNGPGEMADADFGYVGSGPGQVTLYVGKDIRARSVPEDQAPDRLVELIRDEGAWVEPS